MLPTHAEQPGDHAVRLDRLLHHRPLPVRGQGAGPVRPAQHRRVVRQDADRVGGLLAGPAQGVLHRGTSRVVITGMFLHKYTHVST